MRNAPRHERLSTWRWLAPLILIQLMTGCASQRGQLAEDEIPPEIARIPNAVPKVEPLSKSGNPDSYVVFGKRYYTDKQRRGHVERGLASWYGKPFHGRKTSSGEIYNMYDMTAAHKTLPLPTYARVTNLENGRSVVIRINDRGPFHDGRVIDLSYTAAVKLGVAKKGTAAVEVRAIDPGYRHSDPGPFLADLGAAQPSERKPRPATQGRPSQDSRPPSKAQERPMPALASSQPRPAAERARHRPDHQARTFYLQVGAFDDQKNAERLRERLSLGLAGRHIQILEPIGSGAPLYKVRIGPLASEQDAARLSREIAGLGIDRPHRVWN